MFGRPGPGEADGVNAPADTVCAEVIVTLGRLSLERLSHVDPPVGAAIKEPAEIISSVVIENFVTDILLSTISSCIVPLADACGSEEPRPLGSGLLRPERQQHV